MPITEKLKLNVGLRYAWTNFAFINLERRPTGSAGQRPTCAPAVTTGGKDEQPFTPKVSLSYQLTGDDMVYATAAKGYRIGGATPPLPIPACGPNPFPTSYNSDSVWSYEIGTKDRFFDRKLQVSASAYYIKWSNIQQAFYVPPCGIQFTTNAGEAVSKGFDFQGAWRVPRLSIWTPASVTRTRTFTKTAFDRVITPNGDVLNVKGDLLDVVALDGDARAQYDFDVFGRDAFIRADYEYNSKRNDADPQRGSRHRLLRPGPDPDPATNQVSLRAGLTLGALDVALFAENLFNAHPQLVFSIRTVHDPIRSHHLPAAHDRHFGELPVLISNYPFPMGSHRVRYPSRPAGEGYGFAPLGEVDPR